MMLQAESVTNHLLKKCEVNIPVFAQTIDKIIESYPKVTGGEQYLSPEMQKLCKNQLKFPKDG